MTFKIRVNWASLSSFSSCYPNSLGLLDTTHLCLSALVGWYCSFEVCWVSRFGCLNCLGFASHFYLWTYYWLFLIRIHRFCCTITCIFYFAHEHSWSTKRVLYSYWTFKIHQDCYSHFLHEPGHQYADFYFLSNSFSRTLN